RVEERDLTPLAQLGGEGVQIETLVVHRQRDDLGALPTEQLERPVVRGALDEHATWLALQLERAPELEALQTTGGQEDATRVDTVTLCEQLPKRPIASSRPVGQDRQAVVRDGGLRAVRDQRGIEAFRGRRTARERDRGHAPEPTGGRPASDQHSAAP